MAASADPDRRTTYQGTAERTLLVFITVIRFRRNGLDREGASGLSESLRTETAPVAGEADIGIAGIGFHTLRSGPFARPVQSKASFTPLKTTAFP